MDVKTFGEHMSFATRLHGGDIILVCIIIHPVKPYQIFTGFMPTWNSYAADTEQNKQEIFNRNTRYRTSHGHQLYENIHLYKDK